MRTSCLSVLVATKRTTPILTAVKPRKCSTVLIGSAGVGESVLFFLAAMYRSSLEAKKDDDVNMSIYLRCTGLDADLSIFIMFRGKVQKGGEHFMFVHPKFGATAHERLLSMNVHMLQGFRPKLYVLVQEEQKI
jgi:hypothetical protein